jgi:hypothetical protein
MIFTNSAGAGAASTGSQVKVAEARGFEPRKGVNPNRISSMVPRISGRANRGQIPPFALVVAPNVCRAMTAVVVPFRCVRPPSGHPPPLYHPVFGLLGTTAALASAAALATSGNTLV